MRTRLYFPKAVKPRVKWEKRSEWIQYPVFMPAETSNPYAHTWMEVQKDIIVNDYSVMPKRYFRLNNTPLIIRHLYKQ